MDLPQRVNQSLSRIASAAGGARTDGWVKNLPLVVSALLVVLLAWQLVQLGWAALGARNAQPLVAGGAPAGGGASAASGRSVDLNAIINAHLFGEAAAPGAGDTDPNAVAATQMPLVLVGTIAHSNPELGYAIIGESPATAKVYAVGKTITGGTKLHSVYPDRAILDRGGKLEALLLPKRFQGGGMAGAAPLPGASPDSTLGERLRQIATNNPSAITDILRPQPVFSGGAQRGYRIYPGRNRAQFNKLGLLPGDLVKAINGTPLDDPARGMEILQTMNSSTDVTVTIERNGVDTQININNADVVAEAAAAAAAPEAIPVDEMPEMTGDDPAE